MQIYGPANVHGPHAVQSPHAQHAANKTSADRLRPARAGDELQISAEARLIDQLSDVPDIRASRVAELRTQIASGNYESAEKLGIALDRLLNEIG